jgi:NitT/TauT family transport system permease protein
MAVGKELLLPSPITVAKRLFELALTVDFYKIIAYSFLRIFLGTVIGTLIGVFGGLLTAFSKTAKAFFAPILAVIKATPVASFIILLVLYISRDLTPLIISLMMVTPIVWAGVETGILNTDKSLLEMASAYKMS